MRYANIFAVVGLCIALAFTVILATSENAQSRDDCNSDAAPDALIKACSAAIRKDPKDASVLSQRAYAYVKKGDYTHAMLDLDAAIQLEPDAKDYNTRGAIYQRLGDFDRAIADHIKAIELAPKFIAPYDNLGNAFARKGDPDRAIASYNRVPLASPKFGLLNYEGRAYAYFQKGDFTAAANDFAQLTSAEKTPFIDLYHYLSKSRSGSDASSELLANAGLLDLKKWPGALIEVFLGRRGPAAAISVASGEDQLCEAQFFVAEFYMLSKNREAAIEAFKYAAKKCNFVAVERFLAISELARLN